MEKDLRILKSKTLADGSKYFSLFEKHIPRLNDGSQVCLYMLGNLPCICEIIQKNPSVKYFICDADEVFNAVQIVMDGNDISKIVDLYDIDMKFDCIIMNPPYQRNLHLKILAEAIKHLKDEKSVCVNLSPDGHFRNPSTYWKWNEKCWCCDETLPFCLCADFISHNDANDVFNLGNGIDALHIGVYMKNKSNAFSKPMHYDSLVMLNNKVKAKKLQNLRNKFVRKEKLGQFGIRMYRMHGGTTVYNTIVCDTEKGRAVEGIDFGSNNELENFKKSIWTFIYVFYYIIDDINPAHLPWLGDAINPRTGLKGYTGEWTDEDLYKFFDITPEEQKVIEDTMAKYV